MGLMRSIEVLEQRCSQCGVTTGEYCLTKDGRKRSKPHGPRYQAAWAAREARIDRAFETPGRMISGSKSHYSRMFPDHVVVFNANFVTADKVKFWYGDVDVTAEAEALKRLAAKRGEAIYVLREYDARFTNEKDPKIDRAVAVVKPDGTITFSPEP